MTSLRIEGLAELRAALRALPAELAAEAGPLVEAAAEGAAAEVRAGYQRAGGTGNLADHVVVDVVAMGRFGAAARVRSTARHAWLFELGTEVRHTRDGWNRGRMPPGKVFVPVLMRRRAALWRALAGLLASAGLEVR